MFLKSIELFGFKSFADRSKIEFDAGISALLGPNGCGKSNVVDAIKWVLGEQATKSLRADKMEDVIFNGTEERKALSVAEVTLVLSNDNDILSIDMPEVAVKRRLYRSGESEYFINSAPVRLREIRELFFDTGIGKSAYSIMEQGRIDQILSNKPEERRYIFEEAAGITKYKARGAEAERKLEKTAENMRQVESILREVRRSHDTLKKQSEKTVSFRGFKEQEFELEMDLQLLRLRGFLDEMHKREEQLSTVSTKRTSLKESIDKLNMSLEENIDQVNSMESNLIERQKQLYGIDLEKESRKSRIELIGEQVAEIRRGMEARINRGSAMKEKLESSKKQIEEKEKQLGEYRIRLEELAENIASFENDIAVCLERIKANNEEIAANDARIVRNDSALEEFQDELRTLYDDIVSELDKGLKESGYSLGKRKHVEGEIERSLEELRIQAEGKRSLIQDAGDTKAAEADSLLESLAKHTAELPDRLARLKELFTEYRKIIPVFIDEFLAPEGILTRKRDIDARVEELRVEIRDCRTKREALTEENGALTVKIDEYRKTLEELRVNRAQVATKQTAVNESINQQKREIADRMAQIEENVREIENASRRIESQEKQKVDLHEEITGLERQEESLKAELATLKKGITNRNQDVTAKEKRLKESMAALAQSQNSIERLNMDIATLKTEIRNVYENFRESHSQELSDHEDKLYEIRETTQDIRKKLSDIRDRIRDLGTVNLMAPEEFAEVKERFQFLTTQLEDLKKARDDLREITNQIRTESSELFLETYEQIRKNFHLMFRRLFGGGRGEFRLTDPSDVLNSGVEIFAQPPGKKLENIALLSGGERSLTAVGLLFATYMVRPSPFCVLDEIDAALDEENVSRFVNLLQEFGNASQFIVITHNKKTVAGAKSLLGVTMEESGVSKIIAVRLENRETVRA